ncbi:phosphoribosyltransferase family protein [Cyclobacterium marinum]|uniref:Phosphoribosyltransferase n=1 Tax=Cyclobacterium marinum (strain ATCC 25205 / DSM 745 / LMG 13164 / NCIMB 1802) TaxID=880070 RepID=G0J1J6_CYCMS|nr:phosphoribosyltransferase [Cyclobacterium marinum]AEL27391.1 phosphoribosyltransferase [Cyclobacterium marinum DSM 745]MBI0397167.1 phosphoribosyltransferase [Cyclobacterium marinum]MBR9776568.1 phosphoribosyltransferase [Cytophagales bacterium]|tara:strand:- start:9554 stop:9991 length:438 start_codon:yes stop_codon:yes gene_type:complete
MDSKVSLPFDKISKALNGFAFPPTDIIVGIGRGGIVPASLVAHQLELPLFIASVNYRNDINEPIRKSPEFLDLFETSFPHGCRILLIDDVAVSGKTLDLVKASLKDYSVKTFVLKGKADFVLFPNIKTCVKWPWNPSPKSYIYES